MPPVAAAIPAITAIGGLAGAIAPAVLGGLGAGASSDPTLTGFSTINPGQQQLLQQLLSQFGGSGGSQGLFSGAELQGLAGKLLSTPTIGTEQYFNEALLGPSLRAYDQQILPRLNSSFAQHGASFSSARGREAGRVLEGIHVGAQSELAKFLGQNQPLQQLLGQISGMSALSGIQSQQFGQLLQQQGLAGQLATAQTQSLGAVTPSMQQQLLGAAGQSAGKK